MTTKRELEQEIERLQAQLNPPAPVLLRIGGKAVKIMGNWFIGRNKYKGEGSKRHATEVQKRVPVILVKETK